MTQSSLIAIRMGFAHSHRMALSPSSFLLKSDE